MAPALPGTAMNGAAEQSGHDPVLAALQSSLGGIVPSEPVALAGDWRASARRTYQEASQVDSGSGPFVEIEDSVWSGTLSCAVPIVCIAFMRTSNSIFWARSGPPSSTHQVEFSVRAYAEYMHDRATFSSFVAGAQLPAMVIGYSGDAARDVTVETAGHTTGRLSRLARLEHGEILAYMLPGDLIRVGRKRIWHLRHEFAIALPSGVRDLLTRGRNGCIPAAA